MFNYDALTKSYRDWHIRGLNDRHKKKYICGLQLIVNQLEESEKQLETFYGELLNVKADEETHDLRDIMIYLEKFRLKWKGTKSYCYCLADELVLHILSMFPNKKEELRSILQSTEIDRERIDFLLSDSTHSETIVKQTFKQSCYKKTLAFWLAPNEKKARQLGTTLILGTMSAGKSTILNNLLGENWAKTQNQVSTNFSLRYRHCPTLDQVFLSDTKHRIFSSSHSTSSWIEQLNDSNPHDSDQLTFWSGQSTNALAEYRYTVVDTPGMNSSWRTNHFHITQQTLLEHSYDKVIVVLNAMQLGTDDEKELLHLVKTYSNSSCTLFVLNKIDELDSELGETLEHYTQVAKSFVEENGFNNPDVIATSAIATRLLSQDVTLLTKREQRLKNYFQSYFKVDGQTAPSDINERTGFSNILNFMKSE
ncbi:dynamin family protein [Exiguobacterium sp. SH0S2]|uniref:dynamin family protein n=1 Tax=Exiguobacterium sp. SH0S2 TaxID=2510950 RepID=UPI00103BDF43|nr:dynamin family protein [Exiguobacterium sp. SH0S2]TCI63154.1 hypothetical protein EVJ21_06475 [Exiguobacterium sp. SH0S2]